MLKQKYYASTPCLVFYLDQLPILKSLDFQVNGYYCHGNHLLRPPPCRHPLMNCSYDFVFLSVDQINMASFPQLMVHNFEMNSILRLRGLLLCISLLNGRIRWKLLSEINVSPIECLWHSSQLVHTPFNFERPGLNFAICSCLIKISTHAVAC